MVDEDKKATSRNPDEEPDEEPEYVSSLDSNSVTGLVSMGPEDMVWIGDDGDLDPDSFGDDKWEPLEILVRAIIAAHPSDAEEAEHERVEKAISALTGVRRKAGNREKWDYEFLLEVARRFYRDWHHNNGKDPYIQPIVEDVLEQFPDLVEYDGTKESVIKKLARKFKENKDLLLVRATTDDDWDRSIRMVSLRKLIKKLDVAGVPANSDVVPFRRLKERD